MKRHAYQPDDAGWVSLDDFRSFLGFVLFVAIFIALTAVSQ